MTAIPGAEETSRQPIPGKERRRRLGAQVPEPQGERIKEQAASPSGLSDEEIARRWVEVRQRLRGNWEVARAEQVLEMLGRYKVLRIEHLQQTIWGAAGLKSSTIATLTAESIGTLTRLDFTEVVRMRGEGLGSGALVLGESGRRLIQVWQGRKKIGGDLAARLGSRGDKLRHDLLISDFMIAIRLDIEQLGGTVEWVDEAQSWRTSGYGHKQGQLQWDALGLSEIAGLRLDWLLELDHNRMELANMRQKVVAYCEHYKRQFTTGKWQTELGRAGYPEVLVVTSGGEERLDHLIQEMAARLHELKMDQKIAMSFTTTSRIEQARASGNAHNPLDAQVWATMNWERSNAFGVREDNFPIVNYQQLLGELEKKMRKLLADLETAEVAVKPRLRERLAEIKSVMEKLLPRVQVTQGGIR